MWKKIWTQAWESLALGLALVQSGSSWVLVPVWGSSGVILDYTQAQEVAPHASLWGTGTKIDH